MWPMTILHCERRLCRAPEKSRQKRPRTAKPSRKARATGLRRQGATGLEPAPGGPPQSRAVRGTGWRSDVGPGGEVCPGWEKGWSLAGDRGAAEGTRAWTGMVGVGYDAGIRRSNFLYEAAPVVKWTM